jgi:hypothetical protein
VSLCEISRGGVTLLAEIQHDPVWGGDVGAGAVSIGRRGLVDLASVSCTISIRVCFIIGTLEI